MAYVALPAVFYSYTTHELETTDKLYKSINCSCPISVMVPTIHEGLPTFAYIFSKVVGTLLVKHFLLPVSTITDQR